MSLYSVTDLQIAEHDWSGCSLGRPPDWPPALHSILAMMLACPTPMLLGWGADLLCFYNDAYRPILGYRAGTTLGRPFREVWSDIWDDVEPMIRRALSGERCTARDMGLDLQRQGASDEAGWTFSYSPVLDHRGAIAGFLAATREMKAEVPEACQPKEVHRHRVLARAAGNSIEVWDWDVSADRLTTTSQSATLFGLRSNYGSDGAVFAEILKQVHPDDRGRLESEVAAAIKVSGSFRSDYRMLEPDGRTRWVSAQGCCIGDEAGRCVRFQAVTYDITDRVSTKR